MSMNRRRRDIGYGGSAFNARQNEAVMLGAIDKQTIEIDTPMGRREVTYGGQGQDRFEVSYRGQEIWATAIEGEGRSTLRYQIEQIEAEHQAKKVVEDARREIAKNPLDATLAPDLPGTRHVNKTGALRGAEVRFEEIKVRGIDQRSGRVLITRANGDKEQASRNLVLNPLDRDEIVDLRKTYEAYAERQQELDAIDVMSARDALAATDVEVDVDIRLDLTTGERVSVIDDIEFRGADSREVVSLVQGHYLTEHGWPLVLDDKTPEPAATCKGIWGSENVYRSMEQWDAEKAAEDAVKAAAVVVVAAVAEHVFDFSLLDPVVDEPTPEPDEEPVEVPKVAAPATANADWED